MKTKRYLTIKTFYTVLLAILFNLCIQSGHAQLVQINLPDINGGGNAPLDILEANEFVFVYVGSKIIVYKTVNDECTYQNEIELCSKEYGKFNPVYYDKRLYGTTNLIAYHPGKQLLFVVTPELEIKQFQAYGNFNLLGTFPAPTSIDHFKPLHGLNVIKYDHLNNRLYWLVKGKIGNKPTGGNENCTSNFHYRERYFTIFKVTNSLFSDGVTLTTHFEDQLKSKVDGETTEEEYIRYCQSAISDVEFNPTNDLFYFTKLNSLEMWQVTSDSAIFVDKVTIAPSNYDGYYYKFGQMKYINEGGVHKIIALPYKYPSSGDCVPLMIVLDGEKLNCDDAEIVEVPSRRILDAVYLSDHQDLILSYAPDSDDIVDWTGLDKTADLAVYHFTNNPTGLDFQFVNTIKSDESNTNKSDFDFNASFYLTRVDEETALVSRKDQIVKIQHTSNGSYSKQNKFQAEGNYFSRGSSMSTSQNTYSYIINAVSGLMEVFINGNHSRVQLGYPVTNVTANTSGDRLYFYHKMNAGKPGLYIYDISDGSVENPNVDEDPNNPKNDINGMIGDVVYNPYKKQFLVAQSNFEAGTYYIRIINDDNGNTSPTEYNIPLPTGVKYPKEMYVGPDKRLYVMANMQSGSTNPKLLVYAADELANYETYELIYSKDVTFTGTFADDFEYWSAHFSFNTLDRKVYVTIHPTEYTLDPYTSVPNSMFDYPVPVKTDPNGAGTGILIRCETNTITKLSEAILFSGKTLCPNEFSGNRVSQFENKLFILGKYLYEYDFTNGLTPLPTEDPLQYNDLVYSPELDMLFGLKDVEGDCSADRRIRVDKIFYNNGELDFEELDFGTVDKRIKGHTAGMFYNPYNMQIYIHLKYDNKKLGGTDVSLLHFDPSISPIDLQGTEGLDITSFYPELDHNGDGNYYFYSLNQPYFNPYNNKIYLPNGAHSKVSVLDFTPKEPLFLDLVSDKNKSENWLSFPRISENSNGDPPTVHQVLGATHIDPGDYNSGSELENVPPNDEGSDFDIYFKPNWPNGPYIENIYSPRGYKLALNYTGQTGTQPHLYLDGDVLPITESLTLWAEEKENWVGYWLYSSQDVFDALGSATDDVYEIHHQNWYCKKGTAPFNPNGGSSQTQNEWYCDKSTRILHYGDMVVLKSSDEISGFQWRLGGHRPYKIMPVEEPAYFTPTQQAAYTPLVVELDSASRQALEIGAFVGDSCVGATVINTGDTIVVIRAYLENSPVDSVGFQFYYGTKSTAAEKLSHYFVWNDHLQQYIRRPLYSSERKSTHFISLKERKQQKEEITLADRFQIWPNPASFELNYSLQLEKEELIKISLFDLAGKQLAVIHEGPLPGGSMQGNWDLKHLKPGVYLVQCKAGDLMEMKKLIIK